MNIAIFGGSFDPPTLGHALVATWVKLTQNVDQVWLVPAAAHPDKPDISPSARGKNCADGWERVKCPRPGCPGHGYIRSW